MTRKRRKRSKESRRARKQLYLVLVLLGLLGGAGHWNYQRNLALEQQEVRPFRTLADSDLALLRAATEAEVQALSSAYETARTRRASPGAGGDRWGAFENAQARGKNVREIGYRVSEHEASIAEMRKEEARRAGTGSDWQLLLRRIFVYSP